MSLTAKDVAEIMRLLEESSFDELSLEVGDMKLELRRGGAAGPLHHATRGPPSPRGEEPGQRESRSSPSGGSPGEAGEGGAAAPDDPSLTNVPSPLLGVFYRAPRPGDAPFVEIGAAVEEDTVIAIIEVMKLMNSVRAGVAGVIEAIPAQNGALVEYGQTLVRVRRAD